MWPSQGQRQNYGLTYANARYRFGQLQQNEPSRFIEEIPELHMDRSYAGGAAKNNANSGWGQGSAFERMTRGSNAFTKKEEVKKPFYASAPSRPPVKEHVPSENFVASDMSELQAGHRVEHQKFGFGEVVKLEGAAHNPIATINFELNGEKKIMLNYAKLRIIASDTE